MLTVRPGTELCEDWTSEYLNWRENELEDEKKDNPAGGTVNIPAEEAGGENCPSWKDFDES